MLNDATGLKKFTLQQAYKHEIFILIFLPKALFIHHHFPCIFGTMKVCMDQHINHRKGNLKRSVCISGTTVFKIKIQVILQRIQNFIIG